MPKIKITLNEHGQPVGKDCRKFSSAIGCLVRKKLSVACADWRLVPAEKKYEVWTSIKVLYLSLLVLLLVLLCTMTCVLENIIFLCGK